MKKIFVLLLISYGPIFLKAQVNLQISRGASLKSDGTAWVVLEDINVENNGEFNADAGDGGIKFMGSTDNRIFGLGKTHFNNLFLAKTGTSELKLETGINISGKLDFSGGLLNVGNNVVNLGNTGILNGESETTYAFTKGTGYLQSISDLDQPINKNPGNLGAIITSTSKLGETIVKRGHHSEDNLEGNTSILRYFEILPANNTRLNATVQLRYLENELNLINEGDLNIWKSSGMNSWTIIGADSRNVSGNYIEKKNVNALGRWTLSTNTNAIKQTFLLWPNPVHEKAQLSISSLIASKGQLQLFDARGSLMSSQEILLTPGRNNLQVNMKDFAQGVYTLRANVNGNVKIIKINKL